MSADVNIFNFSGVIFHEMLSNFKQDGQNYKVVIVDIKDAYGSMKHEKLDRILSEIGSKMAKIYYLHHLKFHYVNDRKIFYKKVLSENFDLKSEDFPQIQNAQFLSQIDCKTIDVRKTLKIVRKGSNYTLSN